MRRVRVQFVDVESGRTVEEAMLPVERVPNPLELKAQLRLGEEHWVVIRAEPAGAQEVTATGHLRLTVRRVADLTTVDLVFDAPTLCARLPEIGDADLPQALAENAEPPLTLDRNTWRQVELVSRTHAERLAADLQAVRRNIRKATERGYPDLHVRHELIPSATPPVGLEWLVGLVRKATVHAIRLDGLQTVASGFAIRGASGLLLYGVAPFGRIEVLGVEAPAQGDEPHALYHDLAALREVGAVHEMVLLDWCRAKVYPPDRFPDALL
ncbi:MAG: hypothetical protein JKY65_22595 [Planctomycetes bacterium]|nr:hypothetical protein [Planctomycetota bacterium]